MLATIVVNTAMDELRPNDGSVSLREAIQAINAGSDGGDANIRAARTGAYGINDTIILPAGVFKITIAPSGDDDNTTGDFNVSKAVTIQGAGAGATIVDGNGLDRAFDFELANTPVSYTATINGVTIQGGFLSNGRGAGIQVDDTSANPITLKVNNSTIQNNTNSTNGGNDGDGGGINSENGSIALTNCTVANNSSGDDGGGVNEKGAGTLTVINSIIKNNLTFSPGNASDGGGLDNEGGGNIVVMNSIITGNRSGGEGGGIDSHKHPGDITIANSIVSFNSNVSSFGEGIVAGGGGIAQDDNGKLTITNCLVTGNTTRLSGGGILDTGTGDVTITGSEITANIAETDGGGLLIAGAATLRISSSTFSSNNTSIGNGGGIDLQTAATGSALTNVTISDNAVGGNGGGIFKTGASIITLLNDTVVFNTAANDGGGLRSEGASLTLVNTIVAKNTANTANPDVDNNGTNANLVDGNNNLIGDNAGAAGDFTAGTPNGRGSFVGTSGSPLDPLLGALQDNGGTTKLPDGTHLLTRLPQLDSGNNGVVDRGKNSGAPATDERGFARPIGPFVDIGAVELQNFDMAVTESVSADTVQTGKAVTFTSKVTNNGPQNANGVILTVTLSPGGSILSASAGATIDGDVVTFSVPNLPAGSSTMFAINVVPPGPGTFTAIATVSPDDANTTDDTATASTTVLQPPPLPIPSPPLPPPGPPPLNVPPLLAFFNSLFGAVETVNGNGTETVRNSLFGIPLLISTFDSSGNLDSVFLFGINVTALFELF